MPINISEQVIRSITEKYVKSVKRDPAKIPAIKTVIATAIRSVAPSRKVEEPAISAVLEELSKRSIVNDKIIAEVAKNVVDHNAKEDLIFSIQSYTKQLKKKTTPKDIEAIIKHGKLDPYTSTPFQIKNAVRDYFEGSRPLESVPKEEIQDIIRTELAKDGTIDNRDVSGILQRYLNVADPKKPFEHDDIRNVIKSYLADKGKNIAPEPIQPEPIHVPAGPQPSPIQRPETTQDEPKPEKGPVAPEARTGHSKPPTGGGIDAGEPVPPNNPKKPNFFERIRTKMTRYGIKSLTNFSRNWLKDTITKAQSTPSRKSLLTQGKTVHEAFIGKMFLYFYDAKHKDVLPYWDKFPLIVCVDVAEDGWYGLNLHYLPMQLRIRLFDALLTLADNKKLNEIERLRLNYGLLRGFAKFPEAQPCFKRYLSSNVKSDLLQIEPVDWETAVFLPVEQFQKAPKERVWKDSKRTVQKRR
jgi:hypothetical protein